LVSETLEAWLQCQRAWMYLQPIFDSEDIMNQYFIFSIFCTTVTIFYV